MVQSPVHFHIREEKMHNDYTSGNLLKQLMSFSLPYMLACFLQTFYGMADLFIAGQFNGADTVSAVSIGSQVMHMLTVVLVGLAMGTTVMISRSLGAKDTKKIAGYIGNSIVLFIGISIVLTVVLLLGTDLLLNLLSTPLEAYEEARIYLQICFGGCIFITAYNIISSIYRGLGDTTSPMIFVAIAGVLNIGLDWLLIGPFGMGASGAAIATVASQAVSVVIALCAFMKNSHGVTMQRNDLMPDASTMKDLIGIGLPISLQDGLIQVSFLTITAIANGRGVDVAAAVGIVEKIISFLFLVPSAMLSAVSALAAQNMGAGNHQRGRQVLYYAIVICICFGVICSIAAQPFADQIVGLFVKDAPKVTLLGGQYLRAYVFDCIFAGVHFCFSGYFSAYGKSIYSFIHNIISIVVMRIPGTWLASVLFPSTLYPMGLAAPLGSLLSALICVGLYYHAFLKKNRAAEMMKTA